MEDLWVWEFRHGLSWLCLVLGLYRSCRSEIDWSQLQSHGEFRWLRGWRSTSSVGSWSASWSRSTSSSTYAVRSGASSWRCLGSTSRQSLLGKSCLFPLEIIVCSPSNDSLACFPVLSHCLGSGGPGSTSMSRSTSLLPLFLFVFLLVAFLVGWAHLGAYGCGFLSYRRVLVWVPDSCPVDGSGSGVLSGLPCREACWNGCCCGDGG